MADMTKVRDLAEAIVEALEEYREHDTSEVIDEFVSLMARDEELTPAEIRALWSETWDLVNDLKN